MLTVLRRCQITNAARLHLHTSATRDTGYIVLVPEIGEDAHAGDGIINPDGLPAFNDITIENCMGAIGYQAGAVEKTVKRIEDAIKEQEGRVDTSRIFRELDEVTGPLDATWGVAKALYLGNSTLIPTKTYMNIHERARNARASKYTNKTLFNAISKQQSNNEQESRLIQKYLLEGKLNGLMLDEEKRNTLKDILNKLGKERGDYRFKVDMSINGFQHMVKDYQLVRDFPPTLLESTAKDPNQPMQGPWKITLQPQIVEGFLKYCPDRTQRWNVWQANVRKATAQVDRNLENSTHLEKIRGLRKQQANILGYPTYVDMSMETKMVHSVDNLKQIFAKLLQFAGPAQSVEIQELQKFATERGFEHPLDLYDISFWQRKYLIANYQLNEEKLREYFPLSRVLAGLFAFSEKLLNIRIAERREAVVWQPAVKYYDVFDCDADSSSTPIGGFYVDCYSKENKFGKNNGWMVSIRNRNEAAGNLTPLCALVFNFTEPVYGKPYLLSLEDLHMVFKTFGSAMQHLLTKAVFTDLAGLSNIEWDASQVCGNVMCNFLSDVDVLKHISGHFANDEPIPDELAQQTTLLKTNFAGYNLCQELYLADLDIELHKSDSFWLDIVKKLWPIYRCLPLDKKDAHPCSMAEIFSGDWAAAYFSHLYSRMIAADISDEFLQNPTELPAVGKRFKEAFLATGGAMPTAEVFRRFRGRDPSVEALLKSLKLLNTTQTSGEL
ncbi:oligopeptidase A [Teleopsis dalmanni]|uniref:oligopeptidase A n=1 Tax=Teleopsis dalmanni TaxID=139649 RepID=UPI000D32C6D5|nr:oligopeptidase A [Teleopsis dalmanni]